MLSTEIKAYGNFWESLDSGAGTFERSLSADLALLLTYVNNPVVHSCISKNSNAVAATEFGIYQAVDPSKPKRGKRLTKKQRKALRLKDAGPIVEEITDHTLYEILNDNIEDLAATDFIRLITTYMQIFGVAYLHLERNGPNEIPSRIRLLKPWYVSAYRDLEGDILSYFYINIYQQEGGAARQERVTLERFNVIDFRFPAPSDPYAGGDSPLRSAFSEVTLSTKYTNWQNALLDNRARIDGILTIDSDKIDENERARLELMFNNKFRGSGNGGVMVADKSLKFTPTTYAPDDMGHLQIKEQLKKSICNVLHIPLALMEDDPNRAGIEGSLEQWRSEGILPLIREIECKFNKYLIPLYDDKSTFAFDNPIPEDEDFELEENKVDLARATVATTAGGIATVDEVRELLGLEPIGGVEGDAMVAAKPAPAPFGGGSSSPSQDDSGSQDAPAPAPAADDAGKAFDNLMRINADVASGRLPRSTAIALAVHLGYAEPKGLIAYPPTVEGPQKGCNCGCGATTKEAPAPKETTTADKLRKAIAAWFLSLRKEALARLKSTADIVTKDDTGNDPQAFVDIDDWIDSLEGTEDDLAYRVKPLIEFQAQTTADGKTNALVRIGASPDAFSVVPHEVNAAVDKRAFRFAASTLQTTTKSLKDVVDGIREMVRNGVLEGDGNDVLRREIGGWLENAAEYQSDRIARTESSAAVHMGQVISAKASGIVKGFKYLVSSDACPICQEVADTEIAINDYDDSGEVDADGAVPLHVNCTCSLLEIIDTDALDSGDNSDDDA